MDIVKFGGSIITDKSRECTLLVDNLQRLANELAEGHSPELILVHGAGSYGHLKAKAGGVQHGLADLSDDEKAKRVLAMAEVQADVRRLNVAVLNALNTAKIPATSFAPASIGKMKDKSLVDLAMKPFADAMALGLVPVTFGDVVADESLGFSICSGDQLMWLLAREFNSTRIFFVCDVDGVFDSDPRSDQNAKLYPRLSVAEAKDLSPGGREGDVTGAMGGKLEWGIAMAELGAKVYFLNGNIPGRLAALMRGEGVPHTLLEV